MAPSVGTLRVGRYFMALLLIFLALYAVVGFGSRQTPKLGIDLVGGKRVIFVARTTNGSAPTADSMSEARQIIENRVNAQGVTGATVQVQNSDQLVVIIPSATKGDVAALGQPAVLNFRGLAAPAVAVACTTKATPSTTSSPTPTASTPSTSTSSGASSGPTSTATGTKHSGNSLRERRLDAPAARVASSTSKAPASTTSSGAAPTGADSTPATAPAGATSSGAAQSSSPAAASSSAAAIPQCTAKPFASLGSSLTVPTSEAAYDKLSSTQQTQLSSALGNFNCAKAVDEADQPDSYYIACDPTGSLVYLLGSVVVPGSQIDSASAQAPSTSGQSISGDWSVQLNLKSKGSSAWANWTKAHHDAASTASDSPQNCGSTTGGVACADYVGFTLNGEVISAPITQSEINGLPTSITGGFTQTSADNLAQQLNFGSLPLSFKLQSNESVSATLGSVQLRGAFLAGGIGLLLVVLYSLAYYRGLGLVTIASLLVSAGLTYAMLDILGTQIGFTLDLAGIAGFIVALGITADSFVVFFERIKDEVHEGRSMRVAVPRAWIRARRTILSADTVSFLAAAILYYFASADVKGFAFTLGLSTILDLVVVFLFTHPIVSLLSRSATFGSPRFTGLNAVRSGAVLSDDDAQSDGPRRRPARAAAANSARERAAGRRGTATAAPVVESEPIDEPEFDAPPTVDDAGTDSLVDDDEIPETPTSPDAARGSGQTGGSAAERAAARRARRRASGPSNGSDSERES